MGVPISNVTRRVVYAASGTGPYNFTFEILNNTDIAVYKDDTLLTLTTDYTVHINSNGTGYVTLTASPTGATQISIVGNRSIERSTDFTTGGDFFAVTLNNELDQQTIFAQQNAEAVDRALKAPETDPTTINMTLPRAADRANKYLAFDSDGNPKPGDTAIDVEAIAAIADEIEAVAAISGQVEAVAAINTNVNTVAGISSNVSTVAGIASSVSTVASNTSNISTVVSNITAIQNASSNATAAASAKTAAEAARDATLAAYDNFDDRYLGAKSSDPTLDNDGNALLAGSLYYNTTVPEMRVYTGSAWVAAYVSGAGFLTSANPNYSGTFTGGTGVVNLGSGQLYKGSTGDVGVGTASPLTPLDVYRATGGTSVMSRSGDGSIANFRAKNSSGDFGWYVPSSQNAFGLYDYTAGAVRILVDSNGRVTTNKAANGAVTALTDGATITPDFNAANNFSLTLGGNRTLANPTNLTAGQSGVIVITQDGTGSRTLAFGSYWKFAAGTAPTLTTTASAVDVLAYYVDSSTRITARLIGDVK